MREVSARLFTACDSFDGLEVKMFTCSSNHCMADFSYNKYKFFRLTFETNLSVSDLINLINEQISKL